jgi:hypothetical protein
MRVVCKRNTRGVSFVIKTRLIPTHAMKYKTLLLIPTALALGATANAYVGFRLNFAVPLPLFYPAVGYYSAAPVYARTVGYDNGPASRPELVTPAPGPGYVWMAGHWNNVSNRWVWVSGHWEMPPSPSASWVAGHWAPGNSGWVWVEGAWTVGMTAAQLPPPPVAPGVPANSAPQAPAVESPPVPPTAVAVPAPSTPAPDMSEMADGTLVNNDPPAPIVEYVPAAPYPDYVWLGGFWGWNGGWFWHAGHYVARPYRGAAWVSGGWVRGGHGWAWHGGRWR